MCRVRPRRRAHSDGPADSTSVTTATPNGGGRPTTARRPGLYDTVVVHDDIATRHPRRGVRGPQQGHEGTTHPVVVARAEAIEPLGRGLLSRPGQRVLLVLPYTVHAGACTPEAGGTLRWVWARSTAQAYMACQQRALAGTKVVDGTVGPDGDGGEHPMYPMSASLGSCRVARLSARPARDEGLGTCYRSTLYAPAGLCSVSRCMCPATGPLLQDRLSWPHCHAGDFALDAAMRPVRALRPAAATL